MSTGPSEDDLAGLPPVRGGSEPASRPHPWARLRTILAAFFCAGVLWWTVRTATTDNPEARQAIRAMGSGNASERLGAVQELEIAGLGNGKIAIPPLIVALGDGDARVRAAAAAALGPIGSGAALSGKEREAVGAAIMALLGSLKDPEPSVRAAAANALVTLPVGSKSNFVEPRAVLALLAQRIGDPDYRTRFWAILIMSTLGPGGECGDPPEELVAALHDEAAEVRSMAISALASFPGNLDVYIPSLLRMMADDEPSVGAACAAVLSRMDGPSRYTAAIVPELIAALGTPNARARSVTCSMLYRLGPVAYQAIPALIATAREVQAGAGRRDLAFANSDLTAIGALGRIAPGTASAGPVIAVLTDFIQGEDADKSAVAVDALEGFGLDAASAVPVLIHALRKILEMNAKSPAGARVTFALGQIAPKTKMAGDAVAALRGLLRSEAPEILLASVMALGEFGPDAAPATPDLIRIVKEAAGTNTSGVADSAATALGRIAPGTPASGEAVAALTDALKSRSMRTFAASALGAFGPAAAGAIPQLRALSEDPDPGVRGPARFALERLLKATGGQG